MNKFLIQSKYLQKHPFHLVDPSPWPFLASMFAFSFAISAVLYFHIFQIGKILLYINFLFILIIMFI